MNFSDITGEDGIYRIEGSPEMQRSSTFLIRRMMDAGLNVSVDKVGNIFGTLRGSDPNLPVVLCGSHLDSVSSGGMFDGVAGVACSLEALRRIREQQGLVKRNLTLCILMGEEGSAVDEACLGSRAICGLKSSEDVLRLQSYAGQSLQDLLIATGKTGDMVIDRSSLGSFVELHIEQDPVLARRDLSIGVVEGIVGIRTYRVTVEGEGNHADSTPMNCRRDAFVAVSAFIILLSTWMQDRVGAGSTAVCTVDTVNIMPNSPSVIPSSVVFTIDSRSIDQQELLEISNFIREQLENIATSYDIRTSFEVLMDFLPVKLDEGLQYH